MTEAEQPTEAEPEAADRPAALTEDDSDTICRRCACAGCTVKRRCKIVCTHCGFTRDCSDP